MGNETAGILAKRVYEISQWQVHLHTPQLNIMYRWQRKLRILEELKQHPSTRNGNSSTKTQKQFQMFHPKQQLQNSNFYRARLSDFLHRIGILPSPKCTLCNHPLLDDQHLEITTEVEGIKSFVAKCCRARIALV